MAPPPRQTRSPPASAKPPRLDARVLCALGMLDITQGLLGTREGLEWLVVFAAINIVSRLRPRRGRHRGGPRPHRRTRDGSAPLSRERIGPRRPEHRWGA